MPYLPDNVVSCCVSHLLDGEDKKAALVSLMSACGVCQQWRDVARRLEPGVLRFDSLKSCGRKELGRALTEAERRFRGSSALAKEAMFQSAAQLLHGYTHLVLCGEGVTDFTLVEAARANGSKLLSVEVKVRLPPAEVLKSVGDALVYCVIPWLTLPTPCRTPPPLPMRDLPPWRSSRRT